MDSLETKDARRLHRERQKMYNDSDAYRKSFIDSKTSEIHEKYIHFRNCPTCSANNSRTFIFKNGGKYNCCNECGMIYINPVFKDEELCKYYEHNNANQAYAHEIESNFYNRMYQQGIGIINNYCTTGNLLDIGCSGGFFLDIARKNGFITYGIELNTKERQISLNRGHEVWDCDLNSIDKSVLFDVVTVWDVFEHVKDGAEYIKNITNFLNHKGIIFLQIPNAASFAARMLWGKCNMFDGIEHVNLYSPKTIKMVADMAKCEILYMGTVIDELKVIKNHMSYQDPYFGDFVSSPDLDFLTPSIIHENLLGYKIQAVLKPVRS